MYVDHVTCVYFIKSFKGTKRELPTRGTNSSSEEGRIEFVDEFSILQLSNCPYLIVNRVNHSAPRVEKRNKPRSPRRLHRKGGFGEKASALSSLLVVSSRN